MRIRAVRFKMTVATVGRMSLLLLMFTFTIPSPSHATIFFDTNFETCPVGTGNDFPCEGWNDFAREFPGFLEMTTERAFTGTKSVKGTFTDINGGVRTPSIWRSFTPTPHMFARFAFRTSPGFQRGSNGITKMVRFKDDIGYPIVSVWYTYGGYSISVEGPYDSTGSYLVHSGVAPSQTSWDQVEMEWKLNTPGQANGLVRLWVNGVLRIEHMNRAYIGPTPESRGPHGLLNPSTLLIRTGQIYIQSGLGSFYYDRFAVGDTRIGLATSQPSSDTTPPITPAGVHVQ